jgi:hypothetical protein
LSGDCLSGSRKKKARKPINTTTATGRSRQGLNRVTPNNTIKPANIGQAHLSMGILQRLVMMIAQRSGFRQAFGSFGAFHGDFVRMSILLQVGT